MWFKYNFLCIFIIICGDGLTFCNSAATIPRLVRRNVQELHIPVAIVADHMDDAKPNYNDNNTNNKEITQSIEEKSDAIQNYIEPLQTEATTQISLINDNVNDVSNNINNNNDDKIIIKKIDQYDQNHNHHDDGNDDNIVNETNDNEAQNQVQNQGANENERAHVNEETVKNLSEITDQRNDQEEATEQIQQLKVEKINEVKLEEKLSGELMQKDKNEAEELAVTTNEQKLLQEENRKELNGAVAAEQDKIIILDKIDDAIQEHKDQNEKAENEKVDSEEKGDIVLRQSASDNAAVSTTTQANFVQQFIQNSPLGPLFNQFTGQQNVNDAGTTAAPPSPLQPFFNPIQSVVNSTTQAFQGFQQFANNLGQQFQNTLSNLGGQQSTAQGDATTQRPVGPIQQLVSNFIGGGQNSPNDQQQSQQQQPQPQPQQQGPLQTLFTNIFQGGQRPQNANPPNVEVSGSTTTTTASAPTPSQPQIVEEDNDQDGDNDQEAQAVVDNNQLRNSDEIEDSFEQNIKSDEQIVVEDDDNEDNDQPETHTAVNAIV